MLKIHYHLIIINKSKNNIGIQRAGFAIAKSTYFGL